MYIPPIDIGRNYRIYDIAERWYDFFLNDLPNSIKESEHKPFSIGEYIEDLIAKGALISVIISDENHPEVDDWDLFATPHGESLSIVLVEGRSLFEFEDRFFGDSNFSKTQYVSTPPDKNNATERPKKITRAGEYHWGKRTVSEEKYKEYSSWQELVDLKYHELDDEGKPKTKNKVCSAVYDENNLDTTLDTLIRTVKLPKKR